MHISYGADGLDLKIPEENIAETVLPKANEASDKIEQVLENAIEESQTDLDELTNGKKVAIIIADHTRDQPIFEMVKISLSHMKNAANVRIIIATGSHKPECHENFEIIEKIKNSANQLGVKHPEIYLHDCENAKFLDLGKTPRNTPVLVNSLIEGIDVFVVNSDMKPHYFAGYSNALKFFLPGIADFKSIENNHSFALDANSTFGFHPLHPDANCRKNPLAEDMLDFFRIVTGEKATYVLATIASSSNILWAGAGLLEETVSKGIEAVDCLMSHKVKPSNRIIVSCGGYPNDESLYTAQRALELTSACYEQDAEILFIAECRNGIASTEKALENFYNRLAQPFEKVFKSIEGDYKLYAHKAYKLARMLDCGRKIYLYSSLEDNIVSKIHLIPTKNPQDIVNSWIEEKGDVKITVFDKANKLAIHKS